MQALQVIEILAGTDPKGQPVMERLQVKAKGKDQYILIKSPAFVKGLAAGDTVKLNREAKQFDVVEHGGNLCIRLFSRGDIRALADNITPELEKLGGDLDLETPRMLVYSIHVSCGFKAIEDIFNRHTGDRDAWVYGNVYDPSDGNTPLNWWLPILEPE